MNQRSIRYLWRSSYYSYIAFDFWYSCISIHFLLCLSTSESVHKYIVSFVDCWQIFGLTPRRIIIDRIMCNFFHKGLQFTNLLLGQEFLMAQKKVRELEPTPNPQQLITAFTKFMFKKIEWYHEMMFFVSFWRWLSGSLFKRRRTIYISSCMIEM